MSISNERKMTVLLMDDDEMIRMSTGQLLELLGYKVYFAEDGESALNILKSETDTIDLIIMDLTIPCGMGGVECIPLVRDISPDIKAVVSTGDPTHEVFMNHKNYGFDYAMAKPFTLDIFRKMLQKMFE